MRRRESISIGMDVGIGIGISINIFSIKNISNGFKIIINRMWNNIRIIIIITLYGYDMIVLMIL